MTRIILCFCIALLQLASGSKTEIEFKLGQPELTLNCTSAEHEVTWMKDGEPLAKKDNVELSHTGEVHTLKITKPKVTEIGSYICESKGKESSSSFRVVMAPVVIELAKSFNVVEGEKFRLPCVVKGYPTPRIEWRREGEDMWDTIIPSDRFLFEANEDKIENATLVILDIKMEDRDNYMCFAENAYGTHNSTTLIRVIDKYAALWPFLGICVEVIVLCAVIFVCERRRNKKQFDESDNEQNNTKHVVNAKDSEVRNRK